jgi:hypothetical protein
MSMNLKDMDSLRKDQNYEIERKRKVKVAEIQRHTAERQQTARVESELQRDEEQQRLKVEVRRRYLANKLWAQEADFERAWNANKERHAGRHSRRTWKVFPNLSRFGVTI